MGNNDTNLISRVELRTKDDEDGMVDNSPTSQETLFFRLSSAVEGITIFIIIFHILPSIVALRNRSNFFIRLGLTFLMILLMITVRFYDFLETNIFRSLTASGKMRFLLYCLAPLEYMYDLGLLAMCIEAVLELTSLYPTDRRLWILFSLLTLACPALFLILMAIVLETSKEFLSVLVVAITESILPTLGVAVNLIFLYVIARRRKRLITDQVLHRIKIVLTMGFCEVLGMLVNLLVFSFQTEVVMDDLVDSIIKVSICCCYLITVPGSITETHVLTSLHSSSASQASTNLPHTVLREDMG